MNGQNIISIYPVSTEIKMKKKSTLFHPEYSEREKLKKEYISALKTVQNELIQGLKLTAPERATARTLMQISYDENELDVIVDELELLKVCKYMLLHGKFVSKYKLNVRNVKEIAQKAKRKIGESALCEPKG